MSSCWTNERWSNDLLDRHREEYGPNYYSYRGEDSPPRFDETLKKYLSDGEEYAYLYTRNAEWVCYNMNCYEEKSPEMIEIPSAALHV